MGEDKTFWHIYMGKKFFKWQQGKKFLSGNKVKKNYVIGGKVQPPLPYHQRTILWANDA